MNEIIDNESTSFGGRKERRLGGVEKKKTKNSSKEPNAHAKGKLRGRGGVPGGGKVGGGGRLCKKAERKRREGEMWWFHLDGGHHRPPATPAHVVRPLCTEGKVNVQRCI